MAPWRDTRPKVGRSDEVPQRSEGETIEPRVSDPIENTAAVVAIARGAFVGIGDLGHPLHRVVFVLHAERTLAAGRRDDTGLAGDMAPVRVAELDGSGLVFDSRQAADEIGAGAGIVGVALGDLPVDPHFGLATQDVVADGRALVDS